MCFCFLRANTTRIVGVILLMVLLVACGNVSGPTSQASPASQASPTINEVTPTEGPQGEALPPPNVSAVFTTSELYIEGSIYCSPNGPGPLHRLDALVLATDRLTYDRAEIQQMAAYLDGQASPPNTLKLIPGAYSGEPASAENPNSKAGCGGQLKLTNVGDTALQISQVNVRLTADTQPNNYHYRLINVCSIEPDRSQQRQTAYNCTPMGGGGVGFLAQFSLGKSSANTIVQGQFSHSPDEAFAVPTINPGQEVTIVMEFTSLDSLFYSIVPQLILDTAGKQDTIELQPLASTLALADPSQFSCYELQGDTFASAHDDSWCL